MKKFEFTLEKLKQYREQVEETEKNNLGIMRSELIELNDQFKDLMMLIESKTAELMEKMQKGATLSEVAQGKRYISMKQQELHMKRSEITKKEYQIEQQTGVVIEATKEVRKMEKLEENQLADYKKLVQKEEELFIDEFVTNKDWRKNNEPQ